MNVNDDTARQALFRSVTVISSLVLVVVAIGTLVPRPAKAQEPGPQPSEAAADQEARIQQGVRDAEAELAAEEGEPGAGGGQPEADAAPQIEEEISILRLLVAGGYLMLPILLMSMLVVTFGVERILGLRRRKVMPPELITGLGKMAGRKGGLDPRQAYKLCQQYPSSAADVIKAMLLKVGRPHTEVEHAVSEANEREAARLYVNVRWLSLAAGVTPLMGLLGTVWGMIKAFFVTAKLPTGANKAEQLADGIYIALVTTFAGLAVAIPAAVLAHLFETWIQRLFRELDETLLGLMPQLERFEGRLRVSREQMDGPAVESSPAAPLAADGAGQQEPAATPK